MGMQTASSQQPMPQSSGKGGGLGGQGPQIGEPQFNANSYMYENPDVAQSYMSNNYGMTPEQFAQTHYQKYGMAEGRMGGNQMSPTMPPSAQPSGGKGASDVNSYPGPQGMQGASTNSATSGQPRIGTPNQYPNTVGQSDNPQTTSVFQQGKGKGA
jgi:hypothetical protein